MVCTHYGKGFEPGTAKFWDANLLKNYTPDLIPLKRNRIGTSFDKKIVFKRKYN